MVATEQASLWASMFWLVLTFWTFGQMNSKGSSSHSVNFCVSPPGRAGAQLPRSQQRLLNTEGDEVESMSKFHKLSKCCCFSQSSSTPGIIYFLFHTQLDHMRYMHIGTGSAES